MGYIIPGHNCWNSYEVFLPFPFNIDLIDIYAQANAWNQHWRKGREAIDMCIHEMTKFIYMLCFPEVFQQLTTRIAALQNSAFEFF